ncbi:unnamed protein product [Timema podura]|uniref:Uncharacterized protein n=1 Tax=Timema podura TaxID=61482 RepID=A0ABN7PAT6_TIMPD|nr:unnamed protein product [Timema podura]
MYRLIMLTVIIVLVNIKSTISFLVSPEELNRPSICDSSEIEHNEKKITWVHPFAVEDIQHQIPSTVVVESFGKIHNFSMNSRKNEFSLRKSASTSENVALDSEPTNRFEKRYNKKNKSNFPQTSRMKINSNKHLYKYKNSQHDYRLRYRKYRTRTFEIPHKKIVIFNNSSKNYKRGFIPNIKRKLIPLKRLISLKPKSLIKHRQLHK